MFKRLLAASAALVLANVASAATLTYSETFDSTDFSVSFPAGGNSYTPVFSLLINQFDPALGTLDSVTFTYAFTFHGIGNTGAEGGGLSAGAYGSFFLSDVSGSFYSYGNGNGTGGAPNSNINLYVSVGQSGAIGSLSSSTYVDTYLKGTESRTLSWEPTVSVSPDGTATGTFELSSGTLSLTYNYTPAAIPEPSAFAALAGLAVLTCAAARRRI